MSPASPPAPCSGPSQAVWLTVWGGGTWLLSSHWSTLSQRYARKELRILIHRWMVNYMKKPVDNYDNVEIIGVGGELGAQKQQNKVKVVGR